MSIERTTDKTVGCSYIGSKQIFRMVLGAKDYRPLCFHYHETSESALECKQALENYEAGIPAPFPKDEPKKR